MRLLTILSAYTFHKYHSRNVSKVSGIVAAGNIHHWDDIVIVVELPPVFAEGPSDWPGPLTRLVPRNPYIPLLAGVPVPS